MIDIKIEWPGDHSWPVEYDFIERIRMEPKYFIGQRLTYDADYRLLCDAPIGTLVYTPSGKVVERGAPGTETYYGNPDQPHYYEPNGDYVIVALPKDEKAELAKELWKVRNEALTGTGWDHTVQTEFLSPEHEKTYLALADYVLAREAAL